MRTKKNPHLVQCDGCRKKTDYHQWYYRIESGQTFYFCSCADCEPKVNETGWIRCTDPKDSMRRDYVQPAFTFGE